MKMHHGMGGSAGERHGAQNTAMQARNGVCDKIENYISDLAQWYVSKRGNGRSKRPKVSLTRFPPCTAATVGTRGREGVDEPEHESSECLAFLDRTNFTRSA